MKDSIVLMLKNILYKNTTKKYVCTIASVKSLSIVATMTRFGKVLPILAAIIVLVYGLLPYHRLHALTPGSSASILIGQIKITSSNGQFVSLYNNTGADIDMSTVQLAYYNYYDLTSAKLTSSRYIPLSGKLASHNYYMVSDGALTICYKMMVNAQSLGFSSTAGTLQVTQNGPSTVLDSVAWSKTAVTTPSGVQTLPTSTAGFLQRAWVDSVTKTANDPWISVTPSATDVCDLQAQLAASSTPAAPVANTTPQKVTTVSATPPDRTDTSNVGLVAPELTELFPNPATPQSDDTDEFIELYNPNDSVFNLAGYRLEAGTSYSRGYTFATGSLQPKSYTAFTIVMTNLQLSNSEGQVRLLDPSGTTISETPGYEDAPDGESWSLIADSWQWSDTPTPNAVNLPSADVTTTKSTATTTTPAKTTKTTTAKKSTAKVAGASTTTPSSGSGSASQLDDATPLHPLILAGVGAAAVAYAIYEYRKDVANRIFQLRRYFRNRRAVRARV